MNTIYEMDGIQFDATPSEEQIKALASRHHAQLKDASNRLEHLGEHGILQRKHLHDVLSPLTAQDRQRLENVYNRQLRFLQEEDHHHQAHSEEGVSVFAIFIVLAIIAAILIFSVMQMTGIA